MGEEEEYNSTQEGWDYISFTFPLQKNYRYALRIKQYLLHLIYTLFFF
jgi:hypothetical protein